jgi:hypothetical protein
LKSSTDNGLTDCWLLRIDSNGNKLWDLSFGGGGEDYLNTLDCTRDGGFILGATSITFQSATNGNKSEPGYGGLDYWVVKLSPELPLDSDGDGVPDELDQCPNSPTGAFVNASGCSIEQLAPCDGPWKNHGQYVRAVVTVSKQFRTAALISHKQRLAIFLRAVKSDCGRHDTRKAKHVAAKH